MFFPDDVTELLKEIMYEAKYLTKAERCSLFLVDRDRNELVAKVFDGSDVSFLFAPQGHLLQDPLMSLFSFEIVPFLCALVCLCSFRLMAVIHYGSHRWLLFQTRNGFFSKLKDLMVYF
jgi:hypothetical protein